MWSWLLSQSRVSTSSSKNLTDLHLLRRRRSVSSRAPPKVRSGTLPEPSKQRISSSQHFNQDEATPPATARSISSAAAVSSADILDDTPSLVHAGPKGKENNQRTPNPKFSTADRTILEELKRNIQARNTQFVLKGMGTHLTDGTVSRGKKHHPYSQQDVPYPRNYEREVLDLCVEQSSFSHPPLPFKYSITLLELLYRFAHPLLHLNFGPQYLTRDFSDIWETLFCQEISESLTFHVFKEPPARV